MKWNRQLLQMTVIVRDTPIQKFAIGTDHRAPGEDVIKHTWRQNTTGKYTTACYIISQGTSAPRGNETAKLTFLLTYHPPSLSKAVDSNTKGTRQTCFRTKVGNNGTLKSNTPILHLLGPEMSRSPKIVQTQQSGSISAFRRFRRTSPSRTLQHTRPMGSICRATRQ